MMTRAMMGRTPPDTVAPFNTMTSRVNHRLRVYIEEGQ